MVIFVQKIFVLSAKMKNFNNDEVNSELVNILSIKLALYYDILVGLSIYIQSGYNPSENIVSTKCLVVLLLLYFKRSMFMSPQRNIVLLLLTFFISNCI